MYDRLLDLYYECDKLLESGKSENARALIFR